ncbi:MAG: isochorismatase family protein [Rhodobacteraceae bacterium]|nr:isochorismatase family protein [Paracoccaceae bacterium]
MAHTALDPRFNELIDVNSPVIQLGSGFTFTEGPLWHPVENHLLFSDMPADVRRRWTPDGKVTEVSKPSNKGNGMTYDADLNLLVCEHATSSVARFLPNGARQVMASHFEGRELNSPNDICVKSDGAIYFTDPTYGRMEHYGVPRPTQLGFQGVYMLPPGHRPGDEPVLVVDRYTFTQPNGLCLSPCERYMWVNDTDQANIRFYDVQADGRLANSRIFASGIRDNTRPGLPDGMKADVEGNVWVTAPGGLWVYSFEGKLLGKVDVPLMAANLHWGTSSWDTLFICATTALFSVRTKVRGRIEPFMNATAASPPVSSHSEFAGLRIEPSKTALIIQDMQRDVISEGGAFAESGSPEHAKQQNVVENSRRLAEACRNAGIMVIHVWFVCEPNHPALTDNAPLFQGVKSANALVRGSWGVAPVDELQPRSGDLVVEKMSMSAWETSRLEGYLRGAGIDTIINTGAWTNMSVEHTARTAADKGFRVIVPENACSTMNRDWHRASVDFAMQNVATVVATDDVIGALPN